MSCPNHNAAHTGMCISIGCHWHPKQYWQLKEGAHRQTDKQTRPCRILSLYCKIVFSWQLQLNRHRLSAPQTLPSPAQGLPGGAEAFQGQKYPEPSTSQHGVAVRGGTAPAGWGPGGQEGVPGARECLGQVGSPVPWCCWTPPRAVGFPGHSFCTGPSARLPHKPRPVPWAP